MKSVQEDAFFLNAPFKAGGDQPTAIKSIVKSLREGKRHQVLLGATGTGKTFTMANVIAEMNRPTLILCHNKTLAAQLYGEFKQFFPQNAVEFFISFYDYYQPEAYVPTTDTFIEKDSDINQEIDRLRLKATSSLLERRDVIVVASVSAIYGLGSPDTYKSAMIQVELGEELNRQLFFNQLVDMYYIRNDYDFSRGSFRVRGEVIEIFPAYETSALRISCFGDEIEDISVFNPINGEIVIEKKRACIFPAKHFITSNERLMQALEAIQKECNDQIQSFQKSNKLIEAQRIEQRTAFDLDMLREMGYCNGIENYSRYLDGRKSGERPYCLFDFFPKDYLVFIDESHQSIPQIRGMYHGDRSRKETLVAYGFRLPSALDNRPMTFDEFENVCNQIVYISATPADYELNKSDGEFVEQVIRPTGLVDPLIEVRPIYGQIDDLIGEIRAVIAKDQRVLVTTLTKRMSEDLTTYLKDLHFRVKYLHSEIDALERVELLRDLRMGEFDVLIGINLLREGLDLPEVSLVAILDADREGFLRSKVSLLQTIGRAARNVDGRVIMYADRITDSMKNAIHETNRRREKQVAFNEEHGIVAKTIVKSREQIMESTSVADILTKVASLNKVAENIENYMPDELYSIVEPKERIRYLEKKMKEAAAELAFEKAAKLRDEIAKLKAIGLL